MLNARGGLALAELIFYTPTFSVAVWVAFRHGFNRHSGWIFLVILSLVRIIGSICQLVAQNKPTTGLVEASIILSRIGLSPLTLAMLGMLSRVHAGISNSRAIPPKIFRILIIPATVAVILTISGGSEQFSSSASAGKNGRAQTRDAIIIYVVMFFVQVIITVYSLFNTKAISSGEMRLLIAVAGSIPFFLVLLIYSILANFDINSSIFSPINGNVLVQWFVSMMEEFVVVILYLAAGLTVPKLRRADIQPKPPLRVSRITSADQENGYILTPPLHNSELHMNPRVLDPQLK